ncbi:MAG: agmatine deiminase family protein, partial [Bacteroidales bacterium]|nr:agmatine deiminase family protein [Bacteroidales bacterium]
MKKNFLLALSLLFMINLHLGAQDIPKWKKMHYLSEEEMYLPHDNSKNFVPTDPPAHPVRMVAEYEPMQSVLVRYPFGLPTSLMVEMSQDCGVTTLVQTTGQQAQVTSIYQNAGANMENIDFIIAPTDSWWTRDYGPWFVIDGNGEFGVCDFPYNRPRPNDDEVPVEVADHLGINLFGMPIDHTGGNWMCTGIQQGASTTLVYTENPGMTQGEIQDMVDDYLGIAQYHVLEDPLGDYIEHIDCWGKFLGPNKVLIGEVPVNDPLNRYDDFEYVADYFANTISDWGVPYEVFRVYTPGINQTTPYTNSLILNDKVFVPLTGSTHDAAAIEVYEEAMPGYEIHGILYGDWYNTDALHCRTKGIA